MLLKLIPKDAYGFLGDFHAKRIDLADDSFYYSIYFDLRIGDLPYWNIQHGPVIDLDNRNRLSYISIPTKLSKKLKIANKPALSQADAGKIILNEFEKKHKIPFLFKELVLGVKDVPLDERSFDESRYVTKYVWRAVLEPDPSAKQGEASIFVGRCVLDAETSAFIKSYVERDYSAVCAKREAYWNNMSEEEIKKKMLKLILKAQEKKAKKR